MYKNTNITLQELRDYCCIPSPAGALMLVGEWGCGKTYLIEHELRDYLKESHIIIRISLFGMSCIDEIHKAVKDKWIKEFVKNKAWNASKGKINPSENILNIVQAGVKDAKAVISSFVPKWARRLLTVNIDDFITIQSNIGDKAVVLVFDDLERAGHLDTIDILGCINDYIEDKHFHVIILANEDAIFGNPNRKYLEASKDDEYQHSQLLVNTINRVGNRSEIQKSAQIEEKEDKSEESSHISYQMIKEKIVQRTITCIPDYKTIIDDIISGDVVTEAPYSNFLTSISDDIYKMFTGSDIENKSCVPPHNLRNLKCAIQDFKRVYNLLLLQGYTNEDAEMQKFFFSFTAYLMMTRCGIMQEQKDDVFDRLGGYNIIRVLYSGYYEDNYICRAEKDWIQKGLWKEEAFIEFLREFRKRVSAKTPVDKLLNNNIYLIDEDDIKSGWNKYLQLAYSGKMSMNEYVQLIQNSYWARQCNYNLPEKINWPLVENGIQRKIRDMIAEGSTEGNYYLSIGKDGTDITTIFSKDEVHAYDIISTARTGREVYAAQNKRLYISTMNDLINRNALSELHGKVFWYFDEEMVQATVNRYQNISNENKIDLISEFKLIWRPMLNLGEVDQKLIYHGLCSLRVKLDNLKNQYTKNDTRIKNWITGEFIKAVDSMTAEWEMRIKEISP